ncbi:MAG: hypothetical protein KDH88_12740 [Chromatiales bacterium]|nr:hypothetical protein [Chromatiales bacterium]
MKNLFYLTVVLIAYGSLFPFEFHTGGLSAAVWDNFWRSWRVISSRGDILSNVALFVPYGLFGMAARSARTPVVGRFVFLILTGALFAFVLQLAQLWVIARDAALQDVGWNLLGLVVGAGTLLRQDFARGFSGFFASQRFSFPLLLLLAWLISLWLPFVPTLDLQVVKNALKPLFLDPVWDTGEALLHAACWLVAISLWQSMGRDGPRLVHVYWLLPLTLVAQLFLVGGRLTLGEVSGAAAALLLHALWPSTFEQRARTLLVLMFLAVGFDKITPVQLGENRFLWIPFEGFLTGSMLTNVQNLFEKFFVFGALLWLARASRLSWWLSTVLVTGWVLEIEVFQSFSVGHTAEITDMLYVLALAFYLRSGWNQEAGAADEDVARSGRYSRRRQHVLDAPSIASREGKPLPAFSSIAAQPPPAVRGVPARPDLTLSTGDIKAALWALLPGVIVIAIVLRLLLELPGIPYNVLEMFSGGGSVLFIAVFALAVAWNGAGSAFAGHWLSKRRWGLLALPVAVFGSALVSYLLLKVALTAETLADLSGGSVLNYRMTQEKVWGDFGASVFTFLNSTTILPIVERAVRFVALVGPLFVALVALQAAVYKVRERGGMSGMVSELGKYLLYALPWLLLCKYIAFDESSTDNLNELIERPGTFGLGGGGYLYALVFLLSASGVWLGWAMRSGGRRLLVAAVAAIVAVPLGWWLLNQGLVERFTKYHATYSGVDFFLGPDRRNRLDTGTLFMRWSVVQLGMVLSLAWGIRVFHAFSGPVLAAAARPWGGAGRHEPVVRGRTAPARHYPG